MKRTISLILAVTMCISMLGGIPVSHAAPVEYVYNLCPAEYGEAGSEDYVKVAFAEGVKLYNTYSNAGKNWKYFDMEDNVEGAYDATDKKRAYAGIFDYGLKFTPYPGAENKT